MADRKPDPGRIEVDRLLNELENDIRKVYRKAAKEVSNKADNYFRRFKIKDDIKRDQLKRGVITQAEYNDWRQGQMMVGQRWIDMRDQLATDMANADRIAYSIVNGYMPEAYAMAHNYGTFEVESGSMFNTSYTLYNREAIERLIKDNPQMLPAANPNLIFVERVPNYNRKLQSAVLQGILQGESIPNLTKRVGMLTKANHQKAIMYARTVMTGAENAGREDAYKRAVSKGINMRQMWVATLDGRTRHEHRLLDGVTIDVGETFPNGLEYPGDPKGDPAQVYNCRCTMIAQIKGFERDVSDLSLRNTTHLDKDMSYNDWKKAKAKSEPITRQDDIGKAMRWKYINEDYKK